MRYTTYYCRRVITLLAMFLPLTSHAQISLVERGKPAAQIVLTDTTHAARRAAEVMNYFIEKLTGTTLPVGHRAEKKPRQIVFIGGKTDQAGEDGFQISCHNGTMRILSGGDKGAILGVAHLLERYCGINYLGKDAWTVNHVQGYKVQKVGDLRLPVIEWAETPAFRYRQSVSYSERDPLFVDWYGMERPNQMFMDNLWVHTFDKILPSRVYGKAHPEWYALINGRRQPGSHSQWCLTNEQLFVQVCHNLDSIFARNPGMKMISISQNDGNFTNCHCEKCTEVETEEGSASGPIIRFLNRLASRYPDKEFSTLAYLYSMQPPRLVKPLPNVNIMLCSIDAKREVPLTDNESGRDFVRALEGWSRISNNIFVWDYGINFDNMVAPFPNFHVLAPNVQLFHRNHANMLFEQVNGYEGADFAELRAYMIAKLMWNPYQDADSLMRVFLTDYYGEEAGTNLYSYRKIMEGALLSSHVPLWIYDSPITHKDGMLSDDLMHTYARLFDKAEAAVRGDSILLKRVQISRLPLQYAELEIARTKGIEDEKGAEAKVKCFRERSVRFGVESLNERGNAPADYCDLYLKRYLPSRVVTQAKGATVAFNTAPHDRYQEMASTALTDGLFGGSSFVEGWVGWEGTNPDFTLDLGRETSISAISTDFLHQLGAWVLLPKEVRYEVSTDGKAFQPFGEPLVMKEDRDIAVKFVEGKVSVAQPVSARFIRVRIKATGMCPDWHYGVGYPAWCFIDEVRVE